MVAILNPIQMCSKPLALKCSNDVAKTWPLGHGGKSISGNMGPLVPSVCDAKAHGFDDVLWLLDNYVKECTVLNVFVLQQSRLGHMELVTPPDDSCIMNGVMRRTLLDMRAEIEQRFGLQLVERQISITEIINANKEGRLHEMFGAATHCDLMPVHRLVYRDTSLHLKPGKVCRELNSILRGTIRGDDAKWIVPFE